MAMMRSRSAPKDGSANCSVRRPKYFSFSTAQDVADCLAALREAVAGK
jgi:hypothetical protein